MANNNQNILFIAQSWPEPTTTAAGHHMVQLLEAFLGFGYCVTFACTASKTKYSANLTELGIRELTIRLNHSSFDAFVSELDPEVVIFDRFMVEEQFGWRVAEHCPRALRILNTEDLHSLRNTRESCHKKGERFNVNKWLQNEMAKREVASILRSDLSLLVSTHEIDLLQKELKISPILLMHLPFMLHQISNETIKNWASFDDRSGFICFGNGKHAPNVDSISYLKREIWPLIRRQLPEAELRIFGAYLPLKIVEMHNPEEGFLVKGWAKNLDTEVRQARINLAPLRFGAGIKGKLIDAIKNGTPSVTTSIGAEGMHAELPWAGEIAESSADFAKKAVQLYQNEQLWNQKQKNGIEIVNRLYDKEMLTNRLFETLEDLKFDLNARRIQNFTGQMLQHQTINAAKYMGKWIEEKNK